MFQGWPNPGISRVQIILNLNLYYRDFQRNHGWDLQSGANEFAENFGKLERYATCCWQNQVSKILKNLLSMNKKRMYINEVGFLYSWGFLFKFA